MNTWRSMIVGGHRFMPDLLNRLEVAEIVVHFGFEALPRCGLWLEFARPDDPNRPLQFQDWWDIPSGHLVRMLDDRGIPEQLVVEAYNDLFIP